MKIILIALTSLFFIACSAKTIEKESPCACYDFIVKNKG